MWQNLQLLPSYSERCQLARINSLESRRKSASSLFVGEVLNGSIDFPHFLVNLNIHVPSRPSREYQFIYLPTFTTNYLYNAPVPAICRQFNNSFNLFDFNMSKQMFKFSLKILCNVMYLKILCSIVKGLNVIKKG